MYNKEWWRDYTYEEIIGMEVVIHKPDNVDEYPSWVEDMEQYDGKITSITSPEQYDDDDDCPTTIISIDDGMFAYSLRWLEPVGMSDIPDLVDMTESDIEEFDAFLSELV